MLSEHGWRWPITKPTMAVTAQASFLVKSDSDKDRLLHLGREMVPHFLVSQIPTLIAVGRRAGNQLRSRSMIASINPGRRRRGLEERTELLSVWEKTVIGYPRT